MLTPNPIQLTDQESEALLSAVISFESEIRRNKHAHQEDKTMWYEIMNKILMSRVRGIES